MSKKKVKPTFQLIIQIGVYPKISRYFASEVKYFSREQVIKAGEKWLRDNGYEVSRKFIHSHHVRRGDNRMPKAPVLERDLTPGNRPSVGRMFWLHEKSMRKQLGQVDSKGLALQH